MFSRWSQGGGVDVVQHWGGRGIIGWLTTAGLWRGGLAGCNHGWAVGGEGVPVREQRARQGRFFLLLVLGVLLLNGKLVE